MTQRDPHFTSSPVRLSLDEVTRLVAAANAARGRGGTSAPSSVPGVSDAEEELEADFGVSRALAVYGTLAPGRQNHHIVAPLGGEWTVGEVEGELSPEGWGATHGYPAFRPRVGGGAVAVHVLTSERLPDFWASLDEFEGPDYRRILVPVFSVDATKERRLRFVANLYAVARA